MMGHPELCSECDINQLEPLLPQDVVDDLLSKYVKTFTVSVAHTHSQTNKDTNGCPIQVIIFTLNRHYACLYFIWASWSISHTIKLSATLKINLLLQLHSITVTSFQKMTNSLPCATSFCALLYRSCTFSCTELLCVK